MAPRNNPSRLISSESDSPKPAETAGLGRRFASLCYEALLLTALLFVGGWAFLGAGKALDPVLARPLLQLWLLAVAAVYFGYSWTHNGQTLPMKTWRIRLVVRDGGALGASHALRRFLFALLSLASCGLGWVWALVDPERQFLHDRLAGTKIVTSEDRGSRIEN